MAKTFSSIQVDYSVLVDALRRSRGWFRQIARESGCSPQVMRRLVNDPFYDPKLSQLLLIAEWFEKHGVPECHPLALRARKRRAAKEEATLARGAA